MASESVRVPLRPDKRKSPPVRADRPAGLLESCLAFQIPGAGTIQAEENDIPVSVSEKPSCGMASDRAVIGIE